MTPASVGPTRLVDRAVGAAEGGPGDVRPGRRLSVAILAAVAYLPLLASRPGRMVADTKLYLYLDPGRLIADAPFTWDTRQFAGWVPHQTIAYLWPQGPWYWTFDRLGVPDWLAHRLWLGTLLVTAGLGVRWLARLLGIGAGGALVAALAYELAPYVLPYASRTSAMLLPWAGLGWLVGLTGRAAADGPARRRSLAWIGLVLASVGAVNATALLMIAPGPVLWLIAAAWRGDLRWRRAARVSLEIGLVAAAVSAWWMAMLVVQREHGAAVLPYSESLEAVSFTSTSLEVWRGLGYWLGYVRDPYAATTTAMGTYMTAAPLLLAGGVIAVLAVLAVAFLRWPHRRFAALLVVAGVVLGVGVHPVGRPSPLMWLLARDTRSSLALALRSSTRAVPLALLGIALLLGAGVTALAVHRPRGWRTSISLVVVAILLHGSAHLTGRTIDPALSRDQDPPPSWRAAAAMLDTTSAEYRVMQLPGSEFGAFRWGYTVDPPLPGMTRKPVLTRDLLPLGAPALMDLLYALDDRVQDGTLEASSLAPVARLLGVDTVWIANDLAFERFRTPPPWTIHDAITGTASAAELRTLGSYGDPFVSEPVVPMIDEWALADGQRALPPVVLVGVEDPVSIIRIAGRAVIVAGSGDGIVDAAAAGLLHGDELVRYAADLGDQPMPGAVAMVLITDSNRDRARHWRSSQDTLGFTESGGDGTDLLRRVDGDERLPAVASAAADQQTVAVLDSGLVVRATGYGEPFALRPEQRPAQAVDGDLTTSWVVADRADPVGHAIEVSHTDGALHLVQATTGSPSRLISSIRVTAGDLAPFDVVLDERSWSSPGQPVSVPAGVPVRIEIRSVRTVAGVDAGPSAVGFAELGIGTHVEVVRIPDATATLRRHPDAPLAIVLTRLRVDPRDRWRDDPESRLVREFLLESPRSMHLTATLRLDRRAADDLLAAWMGVEGATSTRRLTGDTAAVGWMATDGDRDTAWTSPFGAAQGGAVGSTLSVRLLAGRTLERLRLVQPTDDLHSVITGLAVTDRHGRRVDVAVPDPDVDGVSELVVPRSVAPGDVTLTVTSVAARTTVDRRFGEPVALPVAIRELEADVIAPTRSLARGRAVCRSDLLLVDGSPVGLFLDDSAFAALAAGRPVEVRTCDDATVRLGAGSHRLETVTGAETAVDVDRVVLAEAGARASDIAARRDTAVSLEPHRTRTSRSVSVPPCPEGCWLVLGEGFNTEWRAEWDDRAAETPTPVSGGMNGWWLPPDDAARAVTIRWDAQRPVTVALLGSGLSVIACAVLVVRRRRTPAPSSAAVDGPSPVLPRTHLCRRGTGRVFPLSWATPTLSRGASLALAVATMFVAGAVVSPQGALAAVPAAVALLVLRRPRVLPVLAAALLGGLYLLVAARQLSSGFPPDAGWPVRFDDLHRLGMLSVALLAVGVVRTGDD